MDPKGIAKYGPYEDNQPTQGQFRRMVVFNDGSKGWEIYEYGTEGPINEPATDPKLGNDPKQAADFVEYQKKVASLEPGANRTPEQKTQDAEDEKERSFNQSQTGYRETHLERRKREAEEAKAKPTSLNGMKREPVEGRPGITKVTAVKKDAAGNESTDIYYEDAQGNRLASLAPELTSGKTSEPVKDHPGITKVTAATKDANGNTTQEVYYVDASGNRVPTPVEPKEPSRLQDPETKQWIEKQPDGTWKPITIAGQASPADLPTLDDLQIQYGDIFGGLKAYAARLAKAGLGPNDPRWQQAKEAANVKINELNGIISANASVYGDLSANWRQQQATANTRLNAAGQANQAGMSAAAGLKGLDPSGTAGMGTIMGSLVRARAAGDAFGGYANDAPPKLPASLQSIVEFDINSGKITVKPGGEGSVAPGGSPPQMPASLEDAVKADVTNARPSDFNPAPGMNFSGGQLRAPGFSADHMPPSALMSGDSYASLRDAGFDDDIIAEAARGLVAA